MPLSDDEAADLLHRMVFDLSQVSGATTRADTALKAARAALTLYLAGLIRASEDASGPASEPPQPPQ